MKLTKEEQETCFSMTGDDHSKFIAYSDDPIMIARLERKGHVATDADETGKYFEIPANLITIRSVPTPEQLERRRAQGARLRSESHS